MPQLSRRDSFARFSAALVDYRRQRCQSVYYLYTGTFRPEQYFAARVVLLLRGVCKGETTYDHIFSYGHKLMV